MSDTFRPLVSVVLPTRNRAPLLRRALGSVLGQTYQHLELLIVDDASTDGTAALVQGVPDDRVRFFRLDRPAGAPAARNLAIGQARGDLIAFQDSDDEWHAEKLARQVPRLVSLPRQTALTYTAILKIMALGAVRIPGPQEKRRLSGDLRSSLLHGNFISTQTALVRADALRSVGGFDERMPRLQDWDLWLTLAERYQFDFIDEALVNAYDSHDSITRDRGAYAPALERIAWKHDESFRRTPEVRANLHISLAVLATRDRRLRAAARFFMTGFAASPRAVVGRVVLARAGRPAPTGGGAQRPS